MEEEEEETFPSMTSVRGHVSRLRMGTHVSRLEGWLAAKWRPLELAKVESQLLYLIAKCPSQQLYLFISIVSHLGLCED